MGKRILLLAYVCAALGIGSCLCCTICGRSLRPLLDILTVTSLITCALLFDIYRLQPATSHTITSLISQYTLHKLFYFIGSLLHYSFNRKSQNCGKHQELLLKQILRQNKNTKCAQKFKLGSIKTIQDFITQVPLTSYDHYRELAQEVETSGGENVFFPGKADYLALTSGTSCGISKVFPKSLAILRSFAGPVMFLQQKCLLQVPRNNLLRKWLAVRVYPKFSYSKSGIKSGPVAGLAADFSMDFYVTPKRGGKTTAEQDMMYINLVFGLLEEKICNLFFPTASLALTFFRTLEKSWKSICDDIETGTISNHINISSDLRILFEKQLNGGRPDRADSLRHEFRKGFETIVPRIWRCCPALFCISSGTFQTPAKVLKDRYLGHVPILSPYHAGTEAIYGFNFELKSNDCSYVALTTLNFFEYIPEEETEKPLPATVLAHEVEIGKVYEIVVTTWEGLYRYRTEDLVEMVGFYGTIPKYKFVRRRGDILSTCTEKVPEVMLHSALCIAAKSWKDKSVVDFTSVENIYVENITETRSGSYFYIVFIELHQEEELTTKENDMVDTELMKLHDRYSAYRNNGSIQPVRLIQVQKGTFEKVKELLLHINPKTSSTQYKLPRILRQDDALRLLLSEAVECTVRNNNVNS